ncbi:DUF7546 family protein [Halocalculus aciditolerans]|uniref:DUF7546 family protein n=1 Tax=Halocalculus aciditolerans TaxID=1383812 RepID=UPI001669BE79|nr:ABC transporter ATP-binding protein [Halocalculus aciditolerans]
MRALSEWFTTPRLLAGALVLNTEVALVLLYVFVTNATVTEPLVYVYPWVWVNASALAVWAASPTPVSDRHRYAAVGVGVAYFAVMAYFGGLVGTGGERALGASLHWLPPGYGPALTYAGELVRVVVEPYKLVGYATLAYLVYVTATDTSASMLSGVVGLFSCVSCTWPLLATVFTGLFGSASAAATVASSRALGVSTLVFCLSVALLVWRPTPSFARA